MARGLGDLLISLIAGGGALVLGLAGATLRTGRLDPLDWLFPAMLAIGGVILFAMRGGREISLVRLGMIWALMTVPALLLVAWAGMKAPLAGMALLTVLLGLATTGIGLARRFGRAPQAAILSMLIVAALLVPRLADYAREDRAPPDAARPRVAVLSALPLQGVPMGLRRGSWLRSRSVYDPQFGPHWKSRSTCVRSMVWLKVTWRASSAYCWRSRARWRQQSSSRWMPGCAGAARR